MKLYSVGYGGRSPNELLGLLTAKGIRAIVDVRLRPDRSAMGIYTMAKTPGKGIQGLLASAGIQHFSFVELGNVFLGLDDWALRYKRILDAAGDLLTERLQAGGLQSVPQPFCLLCSERLVSGCHRKLIGDFLIAKGHQVEHIE